MKKTAYSILLFTSIVGAFLAGSWYNQRPVGAKNSTSVRGVLYYACPMHPRYASGKPGDCPSCGMRLEPVYGQGATAASGAGTGASSIPFGAVNVSLEQQQLIGVRVSTVEKASGRHTLRFPGRVAPVETSVYKVNAGIEGFITSVSAVTTGDLVRKDQRLATFAAPNATMTIQTFILNLGAEDRFKKSAAAGSVEAQSLPAANSNIQQRIQQMQNLGMSFLQMEEVKRTRQVPESIMILAPADGFVLARNVSPGLQFDRGTEFYRIADLRRVWILADVFGREAKMLRPGMAARVSLPDQDLVIQAKVSEVLPQFDPATRTLKVRLEAANPGFALRPDMFADVELPITLPSAVAVPADAVLDTGLRKTVFVERGEGFFEPRAVETGWRFGDRVEITRGLESGERIAVSGTFLIDSESRMKAAAAGFQGASSIDPVCGMEVDQRKASAAGRKSLYEGKSYFFCSDKCKQDFERDPRRYLEVKKDRKQDLADGTRHSRR